MTTKVIPVTKKIPTILVKRAPVVKIVKLALVVKKILGQIKEIIAPLAKRAPAIIVLGQNLYTRRTISPNIPNPVVNKALDPDKVENRGKAEIHLIRHIVAKDVVGHIKVTRVQITIVTKIMYTVVLEGEEETQVGDIYQKYHGPGKP